MKINKKNYILLIVILIIILLVIFLKRKYIEKFENISIHPLTVYESPFEKKRIGNMNDGGYVICNIPDIQYDILLSAGISNDTTFEDEFLNLYPSIECFAFDGTIQTSPSINDKFNFIKKNIDIINNNEKTNLKEYLEKYNTIFLKMDIEGWEKQWLQSLNENQLNNISQFVMEFHYNEEVNGPKNTNSMNNDDLKLFEKINKTHILFHIHGNNNVQYNELDGIKIPKVFECTYVNKKYLDRMPSFNTSSLPSDNDAPNDPTKADLLLNYAPFLN